MEIRVSNLGENGEWRESAVILIIIKENQEVIKDCIYQEVQIGVSKLGNNRERFQISGRIGSVIRLKNMVKRRRAGVERGNQGMEENIMAILDSSGFNNSKISHQLNGDRAWLWLNS